MKCFVSFLLIISYPCMCANAGVVESELCVDNTAIVASVNTTNLPTMSTVIFSVYDKDNCEGATIRGGNICIVLITNQSCSSSNSRCNCSGGSSGYLQIRVLNNIKPQNYSIKIENNESIAVCKLISGIPTCSSEKPMSSLIPIDLYLQIGSASTGGVLLIGIILITLLIKRKGSSCNTVNTPAPPSDKSTTESSNSYIDVIDVHDSAENPYEDIVDSSTETSTEGVNRETYIDVIDYEEITNTYEQVDTSIHDSNVDQCSIHIYDTSSLHGFNQATSVV
ncbi:uncharacterized protein LOC131939940 [Physella acuta]|uniref:uncharacterized protein LOC131939940 n=1 Tax=Physella acuta TaxID=109671 RepID=UPI0027DB0B22|nr:uncharacterized protein LOC131939940 [Physella acuta]